MLTIPKAFTDDMIDHSQAEDPNECCGILAGKNGAVAKLYRIANATPSPYRYVMEPQEMLNAMRDADANEWDITAFYHSHTHSPRIPLRPMCAWRSRAAGSETTSTTSSCR